MRIKEEIKNKGLTVKEAAKLMGVAPSALSRVINGNTTVEMLERIAKVINVPVTQFFENQNSTICPHCGGKIKISKE
jgi:transcriptional regulator with XRE-family HTH domain